MGEIQAALESGKAHAQMTGHVKSGERVLGDTAVAVSKLMGISQSVVTRAAYRGEAMSAANNLALGVRQNT